MKPVAAALPAWTPGSASLTQARARLCTYVHAHVRFVCVTCAHVADGRCIPRADVLVESRSKNTLSHAPACTGGRDGGQEAGFPHEGGEGLVQERDLLCEQHSRRADQFRRHARRRSCGAPYAACCTTLHATPVADSQITDGPFKAFADKMLSPLINVQASRAR
jgi:hypothetical protein